MSVFERVCVWWGVREEGGGVFCGGHASEPLSLCGGGFPPSSPAACTCTSRCLTTTRRSSCRCVESRLHRVHDGPHSPAPAPHAHPRTHTHTHTLSQNPNPGPLMYLHVLCWCLDQVMVWLYGGAYGGFPQALALPMPHSAARLPPAVHERSVHRVLFVRGCHPLSTLPPALAPSPPCPGPLPPQCLVTAMSLGCTTPRTWPTPRM